MSRLVKKWPLSPTYEIIWMGFVGMGITAVEESCMDFQQSLYHIWTQTFPYDSFSEETQALIKSILSGIVVVRSITVHLYFFSYFAMLMMVIFEEVPFLALPWLAVSLVRNFILDLVAFLTGVFVCIRYALAPVCYEFILYKVCEISVSVYMWLSVLKLCQDITFPDVGSGNMLLMRAACLPRRSRELAVSDEEEDKFQLESDDEAEAPTFNVKRLQLLSDDEAEASTSGVKGKKIETGATKTKAIQVKTMSLEYLDICECCLDKCDEEVQVNTLSHKFLETEGQRSAMTPDGDCPKKA